MTGSEFLAHLQQLGVELRSERDGLRYRAPHGVLTETLRAELAERKAEILLLLRERSLVKREAPHSLAPVPRDGGLPLSFAQQRLWFIHQLEPDSPAYNFPLAFRCRGPLDVSALEQALGEIVRRHEILRTTYAEVDGAPVQVASPARPCELQVTDLTSVSASVRSLAVDRLVEGEARRPFNVSSDLMVRARIMKVDSEEHILLLVMHHIATDDWSFGLLTNELAVLYGASSGGAPSTLAEPPLQYADYAAWQREWLQSAVLEEQLAHWRLYLAGAPPVLELPTDQPRPSAESHRGASYSFGLSLEVSEGLALLSRRNGSTLFMALLAAFDVLLWRYTGQEDLLVGTPAASRNRSEVEGLIGLFLNSLVLRSDLSGEPTVRELLARVRERCLSAYAYQELPFEALVQDLRPERDLSRNPLFQVMLVLRDAPVQTLALRGLTVTPFEVDRGAAQVDLTLYVQETAEGLAGTFEYATDLFDEATIARMAGHFQTLLEGVVANPEQRISELPLLTAAEEQQLRVEWNGTRREYARTAVTQALFEAQAGRTPERPALKVGGEAVSYAALEGRANRLAWALRARGVGRGQRVGLCVERGADMLAAVLGILKAGAAYVPLDPMFPAERLRYMAEDADLAVLVSTTALAGPFGLPRERQLLVDADAAVLAAQAEERLPPEAARDAGPEDPAYVIYTSGSTGTPKGVVVPHRAVVNFLTSMAREPGLAGEDVLVAVTTLSFDIAVLELQLPLTVGATVVMASREEAVDGYALSALLERHGATVLQATPVTWRLLLEAGWKGGKGFKALVGGETLPQELADQLLARGVELWNMYGPTETTVWSTCAHMTDTAQGITIGRPIANTTVYILDGQNHLCPIGVPGELCIGGDGVTLGYWHRPELTAERFIPDPFSSTPGARLYRTGDRARWRNDGMLEHLGRLDFQVKVRGYRIELGEIEAGIARHPAVREVVVVAREDVPGDPRLVAYLVAENPPVDLVEQLRALLRTTLPEYMVPSAFVVLDALPRTPNAKVDRRALPAPERAASQQAVYVAPRTASEKILAGIWAEVLGLELVGIDENFFDLGGHSLLVMRALFLSERALGKRIAPNRYIFETLGQIARSYDAAKPQADQPPALLRRLASRLLGGRKPDSRS